MSDPRPAGRIPELDGLRGLAILLVVVAHYVAYALPDVLGAWKAYSLALFRLSWTGVDLFFVLSGFLIGGILYDAKDSKNYYKTFYHRRFYRIAPVYTIWIATFLVGLCLTHPSSPGPLKAIFNSEIPPWSYPLFVQNFIMAQRQTFGAHWIATTWSLAIEEQFYLLLPLAIRNLSSRGIGAIALAAIVLAPVFRIVLSMHGNPYVGPYTLLPCRADALGFGVLAALAWRNQRARAWLATHRRGLYSVLFLLGCGFASLAYYQQLIYNVGLTWIDAFYAVVLLLVVTRGLIGRCLRSPVLTKLGTVSYAVYIFHLGINELAHFAVLGQGTALVGWSPLFVTVGSLVAVILLSAATWRLIERPLIAHAHTAYRY